MLTAAGLIGAMSAAAVAAAFTVPVRPDVDTAEAKAELVQLYSQSFALVIGIDKYRDRAWPRLSNAVKDAEAVAETLDRHGFKVTLKRDLAEAELEAELRDFFIRVGSEKDARLLLWFAGHGHTVNDEAYLVPADVHLGPRPALVPAQGAVAAALPRVHARRPVEARDGGVRFLLRRDGVRHGTRGSVRVRHLA